MAQTRIRRALLSVSDKTGIVDFARALADLGVEIVSTGGTRKALAEAGVPVIDISEVTGFPEIMDGRVKTLHPLVHGGILGIRDNAEHEAARAAHAITPIDLVAVNLYPFEATVASGADYDTVIENIDIGGPAMIRAAAKNHGDVTVLVDPDDYDAVLASLRETGDVSLDDRKRFAAKAYGRTAAYDSAISSWFATTLETEALPFRAFGGELREELRYGENPHQWAAFYADGSERPGVSTAIQLQGKALSYNNINDTDAAFELVAEFDPEQTAAVAIIKHANPCGVATGATLLAAYVAALRCDPVSAFGGIVALNRPLEADLATEIVKLFTEVIIAPGASEEAAAIVAAKKNLRLLVTERLPDPRAAGLTARSVAGGLLVQNRDNRAATEADFRVVTKRAPTPQEIADLLVATRVAKHVKSNAIVYVKNGATVGVGAGQMSRVDSARIAHAKSRDAAEAAGLEGALTIGSVVASDAFFPFADGLEALVEAGATAVIQPGGSIRDDEVIAAADKAGLAMVFTGLRHFRH